MVAYLIPDGSKWVQIATTKDTVSAKDIRQVSAPVTYLITCNLVRIGWSSMDWVFYYICVLIFILGDYSMNLRLAIPYTHLNSYCIFTMCGIFIEFILLRLVPYIVMSLTSQLKTIGRLQLCIILFYNLLQ